MKLLPLFAALLVAGCSDSPELPAPEWRIYAFGGACVSTIWGASSGDLWAGGYGFEGSTGTNPFIWRFDGAAWSEQLESETDYRVLDIWGLAGGDLFAAGLRVGIGDESWPAMFHCDGETWSEMELPDQPGYLSAVWGSTPSQLIAALKVSNGPAVFLRIDGSSWAPMAAQLPLDTRSVVGGIWGSSPTDVHAVGMRVVDDQWVGLTAHFDGASWSYADTPGGEWPVKVWGFGPSTAFAVGYGGMILRYDGDGWSAMDSGVEDRLVAVWGRAADDVYAAGEGQGEALNVLHYDGMAWSPWLVECPECAGLRHLTTDVWGTAEGDLFLAAGILPSGVSHCLGSFVMQLPAG